MCSKILGSSLDPLAFIPHIGAGWVFIIFQDLSSVHHLCHCLLVQATVILTGLTIVSARPALLLPLVLQLFLNTVNRVVLSKSNSDVSLFSCSGVPFLLWPELFLSHLSLFFCFIYAVPFAVSWTHPAHSWFNDFHLPFHVPGKYCQLSLLTLLSPSGFNSNTTSFVWLSDTTLFKITLTLLLDCLSTFLPCFLLP